MSEAGSTETFSDRIKTWCVHLANHPHVTRVRSVLGENDARLALLIILTVGLLLRLFVYSAGMSLWIDEAMVALNIQSRNLRQLFDPLDYVQFAPIGWLIAIDWFHSVLGGLEYSLRFFPLIAGLASLFLFLPFVRREFSTATALILFGLFATLPRAIEYSVEIKPYGSDILFSLLITMVGFRILTQKAVRFGTDCLLLLVGALGIVMSFPAAFVAGGVGIAVFVKRFQGADRVGMLTISVISIAWLAFFAALYLGLYAQQLQTNAANIQGFFLSTGKLPESSDGIVAFLFWYPKSVYWLFAYIFESPSAMIAGLFFLFGSWRVFRDDYAKALVLIAPLLLALGAAAFGFYPFENRFFLFYAVQIIVLVGFGLDYFISSQTSQRWLAYAAAFVICLSPISKTWGQISNSRAMFVTEDVKPVLRELSERIKPDDLIYVYYGAIPAYRIYQQRFGLSEYDTLFGLSPHNDWTCYLSDVPRLTRSPRVWVFFAHGQSSRGLPETTVMERILERHGEPVHSVRARRARLILFEFDESSSQAAQNWEHFAPRPDDWREICAPYWYWPPKQQS